MVLRLLAMKQSKKITADIIYAFKQTYVQFECLTNTRLLNSNVTLYKL